MSRGLGDVYKRQVAAFNEASKSVDETRAEKLGAFGGLGGMM